MKSAIIISMILLNSVFCYEMALGDDHSGEIQIRGFIIHPDDVIRYSDGELAIVTAISYTSDHNGVVIKIKFRNCFFERLPREVAPIKEIIRPSDPRYADKVALWNYQEEKRTDESIKNIVLVIILIFLLLALFLRGRR